MAIGANREEGRERLFVMYRDTRREGSYYQIQTGKVKGEEEGGEREREWRQQNTGKKSENERREKRRKNL